MAYLYLTNGYRKHVKPEHNRKAQAQFNKIQQIENPAESTILSRFHGTPLFKTNATHNLRIILQELPLEVNGQSHRIYCVRLVLPHGSKEYSVFEWHPNACRCASRCRRGIEKLK